MGKKQINLAQFAGALRRLLRQPGTFYRPSIGGYFQQGTYHGPCGSYSGNAKNLMENLTCDDRFMEEINRPHDGRSLRGALITHAVQLHEEFGIIASVFGDRIQLSLVED